LKELIDNFSKYLQTLDTLEGYQETSRLCAYR